MVEELGAGHNANQRVYQGTYSPSTKVYSNEQVYFYGVEGKKLLACSIQTSGSTVTISANDTKIWFAGRLLGSGEDRLQSRGKYFPYGEDRYNPNPANPSNDQEKFATYTRDSATLLDYAASRYYNNQLGRFHSVDSATQSLRASEPASWNRYTYVQGDPANFSDPQGQFLMSPGFFDFGDGGFGEGGCGVIQSFYLEDPFAGYNGTDPSYGGNVFIYNPISPCHPLPPIVYPARPRPPQQQAPQCDVMVGSQGVKLPSQPFIQHSYLYVKTASGASDILDAGATNSNPVKLWFLSYYPPVFIPLWIGFGQMRTAVSQNGLYGEATNAPSHAFWESPESCSLVSSMVTETTSLNGKVAYEPWGPNSNSFVYTVLEDAGLIGAVHPTVTLRGWGMYIGH